MNPSLATAVLVVAEGALFVLPLLPAIEELRLKRDAEPLNVVQQYSGDVRHFAFGFRNYIDELQEPLRRCVETGSIVSGRRKNGEEYVLLGQCSDESFREAAKIKDFTCKLVVLAGSGLELPDRMNFQKEIYATGSLIGGERNTYRAILGEKEIHLQRGSRVMRWAHAVGRFRADFDCDLYGRASSDQEMFLLPGCMFQRVHAPRIVVGASETGGSLSGGVPFAGGQASDVAGRRRLIDGDMKVGPGEVISGDIIARGRMHIGAGARVLGSVKSDNDLVVESGACVDGSLISAAALHVGRQCRIHGPVLAEHRIEIGSGSVCGAAHSLTTVSSPGIDVEEGAQFFGTLWAREEGRVLPRR